MFYKIREFLFGGSIWLLPMKWLGLIVGFAVASAVFPLYSQAYQAHKALSKFAKETALSGKTVSEVTAQVAEIIEPIGIKREAIVLSKEGAELVVGLEWTGIAPVPFFEDAFFAVDFSFDSRSKLKTVLWGK